MGDILFTDLLRTPHPGKTDTSAAAADRIAPKAETLRARALELIERYTTRPEWRGLTADECAGMMQEDILAIRPRLSELRRDGLITDTGQRRANRKGNKQIVFRRAA